MTRNLRRCRSRHLHRRATQLTEDQIGLDKGQRRDVQRRLNGLGFDTKVTGKFDDDTRTVIKRWQAARGYPSTGYLNKLQHKALLTEIVSTAQTGSSDDDSGSSRTQRWRRRRRPSLSQRWRRRWRWRWWQSRRLHRRHDRRHDGRHDAPLIGPLETTTKSPALCRAF